MNKYCGVLSCRKQGWGVWNGDATNSLIKAVSTNHKMKTTAFYLFAGRGWLSVQVLPMTVITIRHSKLLLGDVGVRSRIASFVRHCVYHFLFQHHRHIEHSEKKRVHSSTSKYHEISATFRVRINAFWLTLPPWSQDQPETDPPWVVQLQDSRKKYLRTTQNHKCAQKMEDIPL